MVPVPISGSGGLPQTRYSQGFSTRTEVPAAGSASFPAPAPRGKPLQLTDVLIAGTLVAGGALMFSGRRKAGLALAATGTALMLLEDKEAVVSWWKGLPRFLGQAQEFLDRVEGYVTEISEQGHRIQSILRH